MIELYDLRVPDTCNMDDGSYLIDQTQQQLLVASLGNIFPAVASRSLPLVCQFPHLNWFMSEP